MDLVSFVEIAMWTVVEKFNFLILLTLTLGLGIQTKDSECPTSWFQCKSGKCIPSLWLCDGENDCGNLEDEKDCEKKVIEDLCLSSQFRCDEHCVPERWRCDGTEDCGDGSDEINCDNSTETCTGFQCTDHKCIPLRWYCDGGEDCPDGSDEKNCSSGAICKDSEFLCSSGSCVNRSLVCNGHNDCVDGSDEGPHCRERCENMTCSQNCKISPTGPECYCNDGFEIDTKDNKTCNDVNECQKEGLCSHECINTNGSYRCVCIAGYELVNGTCLAEGADPLLVFTDIKEVRGLRLRSKLYFPIRRALERASSVDFDPKYEEIYWVEMSNKSAIYSAKISGSGFKTVLSHGLLVPEDIAVDYVANNIYITDSGLRQVLACKLDGTMCTVLHDTNIDKPRSIVLDPDVGLMYWSDWGEKSVGIYRSGMDGSRRISLVSNRIGWPNGIALDRTTNRLYWADAKLNTIEFITLDGRSRKVLLNSTVYHPYALAVFEDSVYWSDWSTFSLESCNKFTGHKMTILARESHRHIMGIHVYHPVLMAKVPNPCWSKGCSHMCLISPGNNSQCACPHSFKLSTDLKTCILEENSESLFVSEGSRIFYIRPKSVGSDTLTELRLILGDAIITRVSYDSRSRYLFIADVQKPAIYAVNMTSLQIQELAKNHVGTPEDLAFDWKSNNLYWIDTSTKSVEVINVNLLKTVTLLANLPPPVALAISPSKGHMFVATIGVKVAVTMYGMDGKFIKVLNSVYGMPTSLALHPTQNILYWADPRAGTISYVNYTSPSLSQTVKDKIDGVMSLAVSEEYVYWTSKKRELNMLKENTTYVLQLPGHGQDRGLVSRKVTYAHGMVTGLSRCLIGNGGCSYVCLTSPSGRTCTCPSDMVLSTDNETCTAKDCGGNDFKCTNGRCVKADRKCDGTDDCEDGSDEAKCNNRCSADDFQCKNGRCILKSWRCDRRDDCGDNSDEQDCPAVAACVNDQVSCLNGECITVLWRCDGEADCADGSDEASCNVTRCSDSHVRCDNGQCVPVSWICDGTNDCNDGSDERNCSKTPKMCSHQEFRCELDGSCVDNILRCNGRADCEDSSDEKDCPHHELESCEKGRFQCKDGSCIYDYEECDGHSDCSHDEDEMNCTHASCQPEEVLCPQSKRCILRKWICDGDEDCSDGSDEEKCVESKTHPTVTLPPIIKDCDGFYCYVTGQCLPWSKVCDGRQDCEDLPDEGGQCSKSCSGGNGGCSQICRKTPQGSKCFCNPGFRLLPDNRTCDDVNECYEPGTCSHFCFNTRGSFKCTCAEGYVLHNDHRLCKAEGQSATLMYLLGDQIRGYDLSNHAQKVYLNVTSADMKGMDYDASEGVFYWTESNDGSINCFTPHNKSRRVVFKSPSRPTIIRVDWIAKNLYYRDENSSIGVCTTDGKFCKTLIQAAASHLDSLDISPTSGLMFWTIWANTYRHQYSGLVERAEMDGSHKTIIVSDKTISPTAITVDHILKMIYWSDMQLNILECADFHGFQRRQVVQSDVYHPLAIAVFEDHVYWADWGSDSIIRCHKFNRERCQKIREGNVKTHILLIVHKAMQPKGVNRCLNSDCQQICLPTRSDHVCGCDDAHERNGTCTPFAFPTSIPTILPSVVHRSGRPSSPPVKKFSQAPNPTTSPKQVLQCPKDYCHGDSECDVIDNNYVCKCTPDLSGERCDVQVSASHDKDGYTWVVAVLFAIVLVGVVILAIFLCIRNRDKLRRVGESISVKFRNPRSSRDGRLVTDIDDGSVCEELVINREFEYKKCHESSDFSPENSEDGNFKKWPSSSHDSLRIGDNFMNFFQRLKRNTTIL